MSIFKIEVGTWELDNYYVVRHDTNTAKEFYEDYKNTINEYFEDIVKENFVYNWSDDILMHIKPYLEKLGYEFIESDTVSLDTRFDPSVLTEKNKILFENKKEEENIKEKERYIKNKDLPF